MMQSGAVNAGLRTVTDTFTTPACGGTPNAACMTWYWLQGPYNGADPATRFTIGDVRRGWGQGYNGEWTSVLKQQGATEALISAGFTKPQLAVQKRELETYPSVALTYGGAAPVAYYSTLGANRYVRSGHAVSTVLATEAPSVMTPVMSFPNSTSLVTAPDITGRSLGSGASVPATVGCPVSSEVSADLGPFDISGQLNEDSETIPMNFFNIPMYNNDITNLDYSGAGMLQAMQTGDFMKTVVASGDAAAVQGVGPDNFSYAYAKGDPGSASAPMGTRTPTYPLYLPGGLMGHRGAGQQSGVPGSSPGPSGASTSAAPAPPPAPGDDWYAQKTGRGGLPPPSTAALAAAGFYPAPQSSYPTSYAAAARGGGIGMMAAAMPAARPHGW